MYPDPEKLAEAVQRARESGTEREKRMADAVDNFALSFIRPKVRAVVTIHCPTCKVDFDSRMNRQPPTRWLCPNCGMPCLVGPPPEEREEE